jgi:hypothetical protein
MKTITLTTKDADFILKYLRDNLEQLEKAFQDAKENFEDALKKKEEFKNSSMYKETLEKTEKMKSENNPFGLILEMLTSELLTDAQYLSEDFEKAKKEYHTRHEKLEQMIFLLTIGSENESRD